MATISISPILNREVGVSVRNKVNEVIDILNNLNQYAVAGQIIPAGIVIVTRKSLSAEKSQIMLI